MKKQRPQEQRGQPTATGVRATAAGRQRLMWVKCCLETLKRQTRPNPARDELRMRMAASPDVFAATLFRHLFWLRGAACHRAIDEARGDTVIEMPRAHGKTTRGLFLRTMRALLVDRIPLTLIIADSLGKACLALDVVKHELETNGELVKHYGEQRSEQMWGRAMIVTRSGCAVMARGWGQSPRGLTFRGRRPGLIIVDDPEDLESALSKTQRDKTEAQFLNDIVPAREPGAPVVVIGTRIDEDCLIARLGRNRMFRQIRFMAILREAARQDLWEEWRRIRLGRGSGDEGREAQNAEEAALAFYRSHRSDMDAGAKVLWPERWDYYRLQEERLRIGAIAFNREYQMQPYDPQTAVFKREWFQWVPRAELERMELARSVGVDSALGKTRSADPSAVVVIGRASDGRVVVLESSEAVRSPYALIQTLLALDQTHRRPIFYVESDGFQELLAREIERRSRAGGRPLAVRRIYSEGVPKRARIQRLSVLVETGQILWSDGPGVQCLVDQALRWRPEQTGDDHALDALEMAVRGSQAKDEDKGAFATVKYDVWA